MSKALTLYEVEENLAAYLDTEADVPADLQAEFQAALSAAGTAALDKRDAVIRAFQAVDANIEAVKAEKKRLGDRQTVLENGLRRFRRYLASVLQQLPQPAKGARKLEGRIGTIRLRKGSESVEIVDHAKLPSAVCEVQVKLPAVTWLMLRQFLEADGATVDAALATALACAPVEILPDKAKLKTYIEQQQREMEAASFDLAVAETDEEKAATREQFARHIAAETGARILVGEPTVEVK